MNKLVYLYHSILLLAVTSAEDLKCYVCDDCATGYEQYSQICTVSNEGSEINGLSGSGSTESVTEENDLAYSSTSNSGLDASTTDGIFNNSTEGSKTEPEGNKIDTSGPTDTGVDVNISENDFTTEKSKLPVNSSESPINGNGSKEDSFTENSSENANTEINLEEKDNVESNIADNVPLGENTKSNSSIDSNLDANIIAESNLSENNTVVGNLSNINLESDLSFNNDTQGSTSENNNNGNSQSELENLNENNLSAGNTLANSSQSNNTVENSLNEGILNINNSDNVTNGNEYIGSNSNTESNQPNNGLIEDNTGDTGFSSNNVNENISQMSNLGDDSLAASTISNSTISVGSGGSDSDNVNSSSNETQVNSNNVNETNGENTNENSTVINHNSENSLINETNSNSVGNGVLSLMHNESIGNVIDTSISHNASNEIDVMVAVSGDSNIKENKTDTSISNENINGQDMGGIIADGNEEVLSESGLNINGVVNINENSSVGNNSGTGESDNSNIQADMLGNDIKESNVNKIESNTKNNISNSTGPQKNSLAENKLEGENINGNVSEEMNNSTNNLGVDIINGSDTIILEENNSSKNEPEKIVENEREKNVGQNVSLQSNANDANISLIDNIKADNPITDFANENSNGLSNINTSNIESTVNTTTDEIDLTTTETSSTTDINLESPTEIDPNTTIIMDEVRNDTGNVMEDNMNSTDRNDMTTTKSEDTTTESLLDTTTELGNDNISNNTTMQNTNTTDTMELKADVNDTSTSTDQRLYSVQMVGDANSQYSTASRGSLLRLVRQVKSNAIQGFRCVTTSYQENGKMKVKRGCSSAGDSETRCSQLVGGNSSTLKSCKVCEGGLCNSGFKTVISLVPIIVSIIVPLI